MYLLVSISALKAGQFLIYDGEKLVAELTAMVSSVQVGGGEK